MDARSASAVQAAYAEWWDGRLSQRWMLTPVLVASSEGWRPVWAQRVEVLVLAAETMGGQQWNVW